MEIAALGGLGVLALVDSTSFGTLGVPAWMLVQPRVRAAAVLTYLAVIAAFYWLLGLVLLGGAGALRDASGSVSGVTESRPFLIGQLVVGVALFATSFTFNRKRGEVRRARRMGRPTRMQQWTSRAVGPDATLGTVTTVALGAGLVEAASMLPYLAAIGLLTAAGLGFATNASLLAAYVIVMIVPALGLLALRLAAQRQAAPLLERLNGWLQRNKDEMLGWVLGIVGFLVATDAVQRLQALG
ncbi:membrane protein [Knoellia sinensis KCTC 19936]|uniref:Membrane protein n=1 Tax=Knoellia sinensis KCTC 19936 TaxID=1385520 RepID=A0A0A0IXP0_9MICO|nr:GAP family protein [Knoellia sinensis]KGN29960.1 membrane protein [Knoellia sinensis KCTC 19936]